MAFTILQGLLLVAIPVSQSGYGPDCCTLVLIFGEPGGTMDHLYNYLQTVLPSLIEVSRP
jgi:hypothetical protein